MHYFCDVSLHVIHGCVVQLFPSLVPEAPACFLAIPALPAPDWLSTVCKAGIVGNRQDRVSRGPGLGNTDIRQCNVKMEQCLIKCLSPFVTNKVSHYCCCWMGLFLFNKMNTKGACLPARNHINALDHIQNIMGREIKRHIYTAYLCSLPEMLYCKANK